jgi:hypothetical protein
MGIAQNTHLGRTYHGIGYEKHPTHSGPGVAISTNASIGIGNTAHSQRFENKTNSRNNNHVYTGCLLLSRYDSGSPRPQYNEQTLLSIYQTAQIQTALNSCLGISMTYSQSLGMGRDGNFVYVHNPKQVCWASVGISSR